MQYAATTRLVSLSQSDKEVFAIMNREQVRQKQGINLIPSENHCSKAVLDALGSIMLCKYAEG
jgi:glycine hydroxymethyltransferase